MLYQALANYWDALNKLGRTRIGLTAPGPKAPISPLWHSCRKVSYRIVISANGKLLSINNIRTQIVTKTNPKTKKQTIKDIPRRMIVPGTTSNRANTLSPNFCWDSCDYIFGYQPATAKGPQLPSDNSLERLEAASKFCFDLEHKVNDKGFTAICNFYRRWTKTIEALMEYNCETGKSNMYLPDWKGPKDFSFEGNAVFQLEGDACDIYERDACKSFWPGYVEAELAALNDPVGQCLISGQFKPIARIHEPSITGLGDERGMKLSSCSASALRTHGMFNSYNSPMGYEEAFKYATTLNYLLSESEQSFKMGDLYVAFWAEHPDDKVVSLFKELVQPSYNQSAVTEDLKRQVNALVSGEPVNPVMAQIPFYIAGFTPKQGRGVVRFFLRSTLGEMLENVAQHYRDLLLDGGSERDGRAAYSPGRLLSSMPVDKEGKNPRKDIFLAQLIESIVMGTRYSHALYSTLVDRCGIPGLGGTRDIVPHGAVAFIKAYLNRLCRSTNRKEFQVSLDPTCQSVPYQIGRAFALAQKIQHASNPNVGASLKKQYFRKASKTPGIVMPGIIQNAEYHVDKLNDALRIYYSKIMQQIMDQLPPPPGAFPSTLTEVETGEFMVGYYHQWSDFFKKSPAVQGGVTQSAAQGAAQGVGQDDDDETDDQYGGPLGDCDEEEFSESHLLNGQPA